MDDRVIITDPVLTDTVAQFSPRLVAPGIALDVVPPLDAVLISHMHFDHLSLGTLDLLESKIRSLFLPRGGLVYVPPFDFETEPVNPWQSVERAGLTITAVPVRHEGFRYGVDAAWMTQSYTGWVVEYHGLTLYFGGDTAFDPAIFTDVRQRFPNIDVALLPIGPVLPREFVTRSHIDGREAVEAFLLLGAKTMVPIHYDTFAHGTDEPGVALARFREAVAARGLSPDQARILPIGGQTVIVKQPTPEGVQE
jgi:L-ascorbate metabolism protein UlaG (beta-lactamase superfamily)